MTSVLSQTGQNLVDSSSKYNVSKNQIKINTDIESLIKAEVFKKQIRIREFFFDFDRLRKGFVTEDKFRSALSMLSMHMTEKDIIELINRYKCGPDLIRYVEFCSKIEEQFFDYDVAKQNLMTTKSVSSITGDESDIINSILREIKKRIRQKRILLKQPFQDFDKIKCSHITVDQFSRVLMQLSLLPSEQYLNLLIRRYIDNGNVKEVNYVKFCDDVDNVAEMLETVIKGIKPNEKPINPQEDIIPDTSDLKLMQTLFTSKKLVTDIKDDEQVEKKIQAEVVMKHIRIREFFKDYDGLRKGVVTQQQFKRSLDVSHINLSDAEIQVMINKYKVDNIPNGMVNYSQFCDTIDKVFTTQNIDKDPLAVVKKYEADITLLARRRYMNLNEEEQNKLGNLLNLYHKEIQNKRVLIKPHFEDFDKTKQGYISKNQFLRILNFFGLFPDEESLNLILKRYTDKGTLDEVNYYDFCRDVDIYDEGVAVSQAYADSFKTFQKSDNQLKPFIYNDVPNDINDLIAKLRKKTKEQRLRISEFLRDFDKLRSGNITQAQLRLGLNMAKLPLSDQEFSLLVLHFNSDTKPGHVKWRDFCDTIEEIFTVKNLEKQNATQSITIPSIEYQYGKRKMTEEERDIADKIKQRFGFFCKATRIDIKQFFQDWDRQGRNKITPKQFRQVLATVNFLLNDQEFNAICKMYFCEDEKDIRYVDFINDTRVYASELFNQQNQQEQGRTVIAQKQPIDINVLLDQIRNAIKTNRLRPGEYFRDFDPLRKGIIPGNKFRGVISEMKIDLDEDSIQALENNYAVPNDSQKVNYDKFLADVNIVFTMTGLDKDPLVKPQDFVKGTYMDPIYILTPTEEENLHQLMLKLGEFVKKNRILFKSHFQDKDRAKSGKVSFIRFRSILDFHKIPLNDDQFKLLCKKFGYQGVEFNYVEFDEALKKYENSEI